MIHDVVTLLSLLMTPPTIIACLAVAYLFVTGAKSSLFEKDKSSTNWMILGIFVSFIGSTIDNLYWGLAWSLEYLNSPLSEDAFSNGVYSNLPFRQATTLVAALCHIKAAVDTDNQLLRATLISGWGLGIVLALSLYIVGG